MRFKTKILSIIFLPILLLTGCSNFPFPTNANVAFENFTLSLFKEDIVSTTLGLHYTLEHPEAYGITDVPITLGTFETDIDESLATIENCQAVLNKFPYKQLSKENQLTYDVLSSYLKLSQKMTRYSLHEEPLSPVTGIHAQLPILLAEYKLSSEEEVQMYLELLKTVPDYFDSLVHFEQQKANAGLFMAEENVNQVLAQCEAFISMGNENYLLSTFETRLNSIIALSSSQKETYISQNQHILQDYLIPAYEYLSQNLQVLKTYGHNTQGLCYLPDGKEYYTLLVARETGSSRSIDNIQSLIQTQITRDLLSMQKLLEETPSLIPSTLSPNNGSPKQILDLLEDEISPAFPTSASVSTEIKYVPDALKDYLSPAFYLIPAIDNTKTNTIYINQAHNMDEIHLFTTLAHEGYPGHLYQTTYYAAQNPNPLRSLFNFKGYVEGWATYAEMCSYYLSSLDKSQASFLQKNSSLILGLYAYADIGIHYIGWDLDRTEEFFKTYGIVDKTVISEIYQYIIGDPANYLSYYVGYLEILDLKRQTMAQEGENFSQKDFHQKVLDVGPAPFDIVSKYVLEK